MTMTIKMINGTVDIKMIKDLALIICKIKKEEIAIYPKLIKTKDNKSLVRSVFILNICVNSILL